MVIRGVLVTLLMVRLDNNEGVGDIDDGEEGKGESVGDIDVGEEGHEESVDDLDDGEEGNDVGEDDNEEQSKLKETQKHKQMLILNVD